ncbi:MAG TPA: amidohydrolase family protein [Bacteroidia bacterium]|jgi:imidazolonepropionase-like amidohydrolase
MKKILLLLLGGTCSFLSSAQETFPVNGTSNKNHSTYAFANARIVVDPETIIENGTMIIKDGMIITVGTKIPLPQGSVVIDLKGKTIYPGLIDPYTNYGMPEVKKTQGWGTQMESSVKGAYGWNAAIKAETEAHRIFADDSKTAEELRKLGFSTVNTFQRDGIARGSSAVVTLADGRENALVIKDKAAAMYSFDKGTSSQDYPSSLMGAIALLRQTYLDADWYKKDKSKKEFNISLEAFNNIQSLPQIFEVNDKLNLTRADKIGDEFRVSYIIKGSGNEYQRIEDVKASNCRLIIPLNFPVAYDVEDAYEANSVSLTELKHWEMAAANPLILEKNSIPFAITSADLKDRKDFWKNIRKAIRYGLTEKQALKSLTVTPAEFLNISDKSGKIQAGMIANFLITSGNIFEEKTIIYENWIQGDPYRINDYSTIDIRGNYEISYGPTRQVHQLKIEGELEKLKSTVIADTAKLPANITVNGNNVSITFNPKELTGTLRLSGNIQGESLNMNGKGQQPDGSWVTWSATYISPAGSETKKDTAKKQAIEFGEVIYPFTAFGKQAEKNPTEQKKVNSTVLIKNVTVWTNEPEGILKEYDVLLVDGKISRIADNIDAGTTSQVIDGKGKHLTAGIIDEHSHIALISVNEGTQASSAEVRMGDVVNSEDINIYRQLSGGVTTSQLLHGSANPIGGQSALIKLRWGKSPEQMKFSGADGFIKFALGENVKQSNWGDANTIRFPQSRMGVEQVYYDYFTRAKEYESRQKSSASAKTGTAFRRDLELEALAEILNKKRFITCHSYVQSEINMLMHVGDSMGFKVNTFTHILEGYKVADKMKAHGAGASTFSDWWAYKMEVKDAIPYNAAILANMGVVTAINSDDAEMGRRLNQEAAKTIKYGGLSEEEALKTVTLNPAKLLHIDNKVGSIKAGKDADIVLWSDHPLSVYARVEKTIIDGTVYYDAETDIKLREELQKERARIIQKMIEEKKNGGPTQKPAAKKQKLFECDSMQEDYLEQE